MSITVEIGGKQVLGSSDFEWKMTRGVNPYITDINLIPADADHLLLGNMGSVSINISDPGHGSHVIQGVLPLYELPGVTPYEKKVLITDQRYLWERKHIVRRYNIHRRVGNRRLLNAASPEVRTLAPEVQFWSWSLNSGRPWTPMEMLVDVLSELSEYVSQNGGIGGWTIDPRIDAELQQLPMQNIEIDDKAHTAIQRLLEFMPGVDITIDRDGMIYVYSVLNNSEDSIAGITKNYEMVGGGLIRPSSMKRISPKYIDVLFSREFEVRLDSEEFDRGQTTDRSPGGRYMFNVLPVPDYQLTKADGSIIPQGTYLRFSEALAAWNSQGAPIAVDIPLIRRSMVPYMDFWAPMQLMGQLQPNADWGSRIAAMQQHFRRTYRIDERFMDNILKWEPTRVGTVDPIYGTRSLSPVYSDYCLVGGAKMLALTATRDAGGFAVDGTYAMNFIGYPVDGNLSNTDIRPAPATVTVLDHDQGILQYNFEIDRYRNFEMVLPSMIETAGSNTKPGTYPITAGPTFGLADGKSIGFDFIGEGEEHCELTANHKSATIVTMMPAGPNNNSQFHAVRVRPDDIRNIYDVKHNPVGPPIQIRIGAGMGTARFMWSDDFAALIEEAIGINSNGIFTRSNIGESNPDSPLLSLLTNQTTEQAGSSGQANAGIDNIAAAVAAAIYAWYADRSIGRATIPIGPDLPSINGTVDEISVSVDIDGVSRVGISLPEVLPQLDPAAFMDPATRRIIFRNVV